MDAEDRGYEALLEAALKDRSKVERMAVLGGVGAGVGYSIAKDLGARSIASSVSAATLAAVGASIAHKSIGPASDKSGELDFRSIKLSMSVTEAVILPLTGGVFFMASNDPKMRRDGLGLVTVGAIGMLVSYLAMQKQESP